MSTANRYRIYTRGKRSGGTIWYIENSQSGERRSLGTSDEAEAKKVLAAHNDQLLTAQAHIKIAQVHQALADAESKTRTWQDVMNYTLKVKTGSTRERWERAVKSKSFDPIRNVPVSQTTIDNFQAVFELGRVSTNKFLREMQNIAIESRWLLNPVVTSKLWPKHKPKSKRAITYEEHCRILERETNPERKAFYELCWHTGGSQSDVANLSIENVNWEKGVVCFRRKKTGSVCAIKMGESLKVLIQNLPKEGKFFPMLSAVREKDRATEFAQRCKGLGIVGVTLHSYRYGLAQRAADRGFPERYAQQMLGHGSKAVTRAYAEKNYFEVPSLEAFEAGLK